MTSKQKVIGWFVANVMLRLGLLMVGIGSILEANHASRGFVVSVVGGCIFLVSLLAWGFFADGGPIWKIWWGDLHQTIESYPANEQEWAALRPWGIGFLEELADDATIYFDRRDDSQRKLLAKKGGGANYPIKEVGEPSELIAERKRRLAAIDNFNLDIANLTKVHLMNSRNADYAWRRYLRIWDFFKKKGIRPQQSREKFWEDPDAFRIFRATQKASRIHVDA